MKSFLVLMSLFFTVSAFADAGTLVCRVETNADTFETVEVPISKARAGVNLGTVHGSKTAMSILASVRNNAEGQAQIYIIASNGETEVSASGSLEATLSLHSPKEKLSLDVICTLK